MRHSLLALMILMLGCSHSDRNGLLLAGVDQSKPGVLVFGDSISLGYTPYIINGRPDLNVLHTPDNNMSSSNGVQVIEYVLKQRHEWSTVVFNHGFWDMPGNEQHVPIEVYKDNLRREVLLMKQYTPRIIFCTTTNVPRDFPSFTNIDVDEYNSAARDVMNALNVLVLDLNVVARGIDYLHISLMDLHWTAAGSQILAQAILNIL